MAVAVDVVELLSSVVRAMGTDVELLVLDGDEAHLRWAHAELSRLESLWSRFLPESDVSRINASAGRPVEVAPETVDLVVQAARAWTTSGGAFDPLLGRELCALGYDRPFAEIDGARAGVATAPGGAGHAGSDLAVDVDARTVRVAEGRSLDLGGLAKGAAADMLVEGLLSRGARGACANLGGDLAVGGAAPHPSGWIVDVAHCAAASLPADVLALYSGGAATSTTLRRAWRGPRGDERHHLVDPSTGGPVAGPLVEATVVAPSAAHAEVLTKVAFVTPDRLAPALAAVGGGAALTHRDGSTHQVGALPWCR